MTPFALLQSLCSDRETGLLFAVMEGNRQLRIGLVDGEIVHITYALKRGPITFGLLAASHAVSASFSRGMVSDIQATLPSTSEILRRLQAPLSSGECPAAPAPPSPTPTAPAKQLWKNSEARARNPSIDELRNLLVDYIGPIGDLLIDQEIQNGFESWPELVDRLAQDVTPEAEASAFRMAALRLSH